jgi:hypothetical protein
MGGRTWLSVLALALALVTGSPVWAADTGTISGAVFDGQGQPVDGATVRISGAALPVGRSVVTGTNGAYQLEHLLPGTYTIEIEKGDIGRTTREAIVEVGKDTQVDVVLGPVAAEDLVVTAARPIVDVRSTEAGFNFSADVFNSLPLERTYRGLFQLIPGVADNRSPLGPAAGGSRQDNTYLMDGANITTPSYGYLSTEVNELDIAEINLKRAGISAEFGRTAGTVTNAVSRSGSNRFSGIARFDWLPDDLVAAYRLPDELVRAGVRPGTFRDLLLTTELGVAGGLGGPLVKDRIFFYGSARQAQRTKWDRVNKVGTPLPDEVRGGPEFFGKLTASPTANDQLTVSLREQPSYVDDAGLTSDFAPSVAANTDNSSRIAAADWANFTGAGTSLNVRFLYMKEENEDRPVTDLGYLPPFDPGNLAAMGQYMDPAQANLTVGGNQYTSVQNYRRHELRGVFSQFFDIGRSSHVLKAGAGFERAEERFNRLANGWGAIVNINVSNVPALRTRYFTPQVPQLGYGHTLALFVQDEITTKRLAVNVGVLLNRDEFSQNVEGSGGCPANLPLKGGTAVYESDGDTCTFIRFGFDDEVQPRLGASYQIRDSAGDKVYANWGRYFNMDQKSTSRSLAPNRIFQTQTVFGLDGQMLSSGPLASTTGKLVDPALKPIYSDEFLVGYATPFGRSHSVDVFFMSRRMRNFIEDVPSRMNGTAPDSGPFVAANLPCTAFAACQSADARRSYRAITIDVRRRLSNRWMSDVSYTWSQFEGNYDLDYSTLPVFNTSSFIQDGPGTNVEDPNRFGPLLEDRPHVLKVLGSYAPTERITASGYLRVQSGTPWAARARDSQGAVLNYLEPAGSHRNPAWANLDLMIAYRVPATARASLTFEARLLNVFDNQTQLSTDSQQYLDLRTIPTPPYFAPYLQPNPFFGTGNSFAPPRRLYLAAALSF